MYCVSYLCNRTGISCIGVMADGYSVSCPFGDGETKMEYKHPDLEESYKSKHDISEAISEYYEDLNEAEKEFENIEEINVGYIWHPVEFCLTIKGAKEYMQANAHNHGKLRTYVSHFNTRNFEMTKLLKTLQFKGKNE